MLPVPRYNEILSPPGAHAVVDFRCGRGKMFKHAVEFQLGDDAAFDPPGRTFEIVASIRTSWIGGRRVGGLDIMRAVAAPDALAQNA